MFEKRYNREIERLRDPQRVARLEVERVATLALEGLDPGCVVLDIGVGSGLFAECFARMGCRVAGVDVNPAMLLAAKEFVPDGLFKEGIAEKLPFGKDEFDLAYMGLVLHETDNPLAALKEARRVARTRLAILEWPYEEPGSFGPPIDHRISPERLSALAREAGYRKVQQTRLEHLCLYRLDETDLLSGLR